jgi:hypothetical protein
MTYHMFVDDIRNPDWVYPDQDVSDWIVCRSMEEAQHVIADLGWPSWISLDHDLGDHVPTGYDLTKWMVTQDQDQNLMPEAFEVQVHSANPVGAENIRRMWENYLKFKAWWNTT